MHGKPDPAIYRAGMSSLLHPVGHLPASVYWVRRAIALLLLLVLVVVLFRVFGGSDQKPTASSGPAATTPSETPSALLSASPGAVSSAGRTSTSSAGPTTAASDVPTSATTGKPARDDGKCTGATVRIVVVPAARRVLAGRPLNLQVQLSTTRRDGCAAVVDANRLVVTVISGKDRIWTTTHCVAAVARATLALSPGKSSTTTVTWTGRRSAPKCPGTTTAAKPGTYVVQGVYDGHASTPQAFNVV